ncbi:MAG: hypothetical protein WAL37_16760, partial [Xanthobacteraceae bacterium]
MPNKNPEVQISPGPDEKINDRRAHAALVPKTLSENIAPHIETIPIQTLTISDEQFLKGDASGSP